MDVEKFQKFPGSIQESGRIVISCRDNYMAVWSGRHSAKETIIQFLGIVAWRTVVEHVTRYK
jgi:hypothetical protein